MFYLGATPEVMCRAFPRTLKGDALTWFLRLPTNSIDSWQTLYHRFSRHFIIARENPKTAHTLAQIKQIEKETLKDFLSRFYTEAAQIPLITDAMQVHCAIEGVRPGSEFALALAEEIPASMDEFRLKAARYIRREEHVEMAKTLRAGSANPVVDQKFHQSIIVLPKF